MVFGSAEGGALRYFIIDQDKGYTDIPNPVNWFYKLGPGDAMKSIQKFPDREIFLIHTGDSPTYIDFMTEPMIMVTEKVKKCLQLYEPNMQFKEIVLLDREKKKSQNYFVPKFTELDCMTDRSTYTNWNYDVNYVELDEQKIGDKAIFILKGPEKRNIIVRLDVAESLLRRGTKGFILKETDVKG